MCGVFGLARFDGQGIEKAWMARMGLLLSHRGPDAEGFFFHPESDQSAKVNVAFGHERLSILDLSSKSNQPFIDRSNDLVLVYNGEVYNFKEIRQLLKAKGYLFNSEGDTEVVMAAYKEWGIHAAKYLDGMFAFAIWDKRRSQIVVSRDSIGIKPLYYFEGNNSFAFSSELKALLSLPMVERKINSAALADYLSLRYIPAPHSIVSNVHKLEPGHTLVVSTETGRSIKEKHWNVPFSQDQRDIAFNEADAAERFDELFNKVVKEQLVSDVSVGCFLSGGLDSSLVAAVARKHYGPELKTFTIGFSEPEFNEAVFARKIAKQLGTSHHEHYVEGNDMVDLVQSLYSVYDEPFGDASAIPSIVLTRYAGAHLKVCLSGDGGDELFHGYQWYKQFDRLANIFRAPLGIRKLFFKTIFRKRYENTIIEGVLERKFSEAVKYNCLFSPVMRKNLIGTSVGSYSGLVDGIFNDKPGSRDEMYHNIFKLGLLSWLPGDFLVKVDRASMAEGLEVRVPMLDRRLVEFAANLPLKANRPGDQGKLLVKKALSRYLPQNLYDRPKKGFSIPLTKWLADNLFEMVSDLLSKRSVETYGILNPKAVQGHLDAFCRFPEKEATRIWLLLNLQLWCENNLKQSSV
ncbi:MAG: asparagine synthase (glutamine-hydrolyzing) [Desulfobacter sp.]|nr:MAG: asparagine synthase (glutamine-hydrolyzing) [Desulfobacter sp.]